MYLNLNTPCLAIYNQLKLEMIEHLFELLFYCEIFGVIQTFLNILISILKLMMY
jgi:hypothetical protein